MKSDKKYLLFLIIFVICSFFYVDIEEHKNGSNENNKYSEREIIGELKDAVKLVVDGNLNIYYLTFGKFNKNQRKNKKNVIP